jgi:UDP-N-acetylglucosamine 2-epimerase (non-hydrolysing)
MVDSLFRLLPLARAGRPLERWGLEPRGYVLVTLHRPSLVDDPRRLGAVVDVLGEIAAEHPVVLPVHPRLKRQLTGSPPPGLIATDPLGYLDFIALEEQARLVVTDSGGVQEETSALGVPCITYRTATERPVTLTEGTNRLVRLDPAELALAARELLSGPRPDGTPAIHLWDGAAGPRAAAVVAEFLAQSVG